MATTTAGTAATTTLTALLWTPAVAVADIATMQALILDDGTFPAGGTRANNLVTADRQAANTQGQIPGSFINNGRLYIPNRGWLQLVPGDWVAIDNTGWPILLSELAMANGGSGNWRHP